MDSLGSKSNRDFLSSQLFDQILEVFSNSSPIENLKNDALGKEVIAKVNEEFKGVEHIEFSSNCDDIITGANLPRTFKINHILRSMGVNKRVISFYDILQYGFPSINQGSHSDSMIIYPNEGPNENLRQDVLKLIGKNKIKYPVIVAGLDIERADNALGFKFKGTYYLKIIKMHQIQYQRDGKNPSVDVVTWLKYYPEADIVKTVPAKYALSKDYQGLDCFENAVRTNLPGDPSGLRAVYQDRGKYFELTLDNLVFANATSVVNLVNLDKINKNSEKHMYRGDLENITRTM